MSGTEEMWKKRVADWRASGQTAEAFSAGRRWSANTLRWWSSRLRQPAAPRMVRVAQVIRARAGREEAERRGAIVVEARDARITIERGADREMVATVLEVMATRGSR
jgi:hypothetical protein